MRTGVIWTACCLFLAAVCTDVAASGTKEEPAGFSGVISPVDSDATTETASLFAWLRDLSGKGIVFGHQHETTQGLLTKDVAGAAESDTRKAVGDFAGISGWDTLSIVGERPEGNIENHVRAARERGGIVTISTHFPNPGTGGDAWDVTPAIRDVLAGGAALARYNGFLDDVAEWAKAAVDGNGKPIPMIFRILHENTGSWFWWGASQSSPDEYRNIFRYTVEYLRDVKGVHNFLYAYSPSDTFRGDEKLYLERYPGDSYVDILGFDAYGPAANNRAWFDSVVKNAALVSRMAAARGKISAITEVGISAEHIAAGVFDADWYTSLLNALKSDPDAGRISYFLVWRNGAANHYWVPYPGDRSGMLEDFKTFHADPYTLFNGDLKGVYTMKPEAAERQPEAYILFPTDLLSVSGDLRVKARVGGIDGTPVVRFELDGGKAIELAGTGDGSYQAVLGTGELVENKMYTGTLTASCGDVRLTDTVSFIIDNIPDAARPGFVNDFERYGGNDGLLKNDFTSAGDGAAASLVPTGTGSALAFTYTLGSGGYAGLNHALKGLDWGAFNTIRLRVTPDGKGQRLVLQLTASGSSWEAYRIMGDRNDSVTVRSVNRHGSQDVIPVLTAASILEIPFSSLVRADWDSTKGDFNPSKVTALSFYVNAVDRGTEVRDSRVVIDDIEVVYVKGNGDYSRGKPVPVSRKAAFEFGFDGLTAEGWNAELWGGSVTVKLSVNAGGNLLVSPSWGNAGSDKIAITKVLPNSLDMNGGSVRADVFIPEAVVKDGKLYVKVFLKDGAGRYGNFGDLRTSSLKPGWNSLSYANISRSGVGWKQDGFDLSTASVFGIEFASEGKPESVGGDILIDNVGISGR